MRKILLCSILCCLNCCINIEGKTEPSSCNGAFDVYFVLDLSSSLLKAGRNHFREETVSFVKQLVDKFTSPLLRLSFITFNYKARLVMPLTYDRSIVNEKLSELRLAVPDGMTKLGLGMLEVTSQMKQNAQKRASVVIILTDGILEYTTKMLAVKEANRARKLGGTVLAVGVGDFDPDQLVEIVGGSNQLVFKAASFDGLNRIVKRVIDGSCVEITSAEPEIVCSNSTFEVQVYGRGFNKTGDPSQVKCNYWFNKTTSLMVSPATFSHTVLTCPSPRKVNLKPGDVVVLQVTLNGGVSFISSNVTISTGVCANSGGKGWAIFLILGFLLLSFLIWWFWKALCCVVATKPKKQPARPKRPPPRPLPNKVMETQQWPVVDASFYGGRGAGGINPMKVQWGDRGCTEAGLHLEKTKDAQEVGFVEREVLVDPPTSSAPQQRKKETSYCAMLCTLCTCFNRLSLKRPDADDVGGCVFVKKDRSSKNDDESSSQMPGYYDTRE